MNTHYSEVLKKIPSYFRPSSPIDSEEFLKGRISELERVDEILSHDWRSTFIIGERGVGKTSLAKTAAFLHDVAPFLSTIEK